MARPTTRPDSRFLQARKVVPADLRAILGRTEFKRSLPAASHAEVKRLHRACMDQWEAEIAAACAQLHGAVQTLTDKEIRGLCGEWYRAELAHREHNPGAPYGWEMVLESLDDEWPDHDQDEEQPPLQPSPRRLSGAETILRQHGISPDSDTLRRFAVALHETE